MMAEHFRDMSEIAKREKAKADAYRAAELRLAAHAKEHFLAQEESRANRHERRKIAAIERTKPLSIRNVGAQDASGRKRQNIYKCEDGHLVVTIDRDKGVTPFMIHCLAEGCDKRAYSHFYNPNCLAFEPTHEWYSPDDKEKLTLDEATLDHIKRGGLLLRKIEQ